MAMSKWFKIKVLVKQSIILMYERVTQVTLFLMFGIMHETVHRINCKRVLKLLNIFIVM